MKAIILAGGYATRLYPLTKNFPKPLIEIACKPILNHTLERIPALVDKVYITSNNRFYSFFYDWLKTQCSYSEVVLINDGSSSEETKRGTIGSLVFTLETEKIDDDLLVLPADTLADWDIGLLVDKCREHGKTTIGLYDTKDNRLARGYGVVKLGPHNEIIASWDKPENPETTLIDNFSYVFPQNTLFMLKEFIRQPKGSKFFEYLCMNDGMYGYPNATYYFDIGTLERLETARRFFEAVNREPNNPDLK